MTEKAKDRGAPVHHPSANPWVDDPRHAGTIMVTAHRPGDVVLSIDPHGGDEGYDPDESSDEQPS